MCGVQDTTSSQRSSKSSILKEHSKKMNKTVDALHTDCFIYTALEYTPERHRFQKKEL